jgi:hypothetical protein
VQKAAQFKPKISQCSEQAVGTSGQRFNVHIYIVTRYCLKRKCGPIHLSGTIQHVVHFTLVK